MPPSPLSHAAAPSTPCSPITPMLLRLAFPHRSPVLLCPRPWPLPPPVHLGTCSTAAAAAAALVLLRPKLPDRCPCAPRPALHGRRRCPMRLRPTLHGRRHQREEERAAQHGVAAGTRARRPSEVKPTRGGVALRGEDAILHGVPWSSGRGTVAGWLV
ncbi:hypothetical protein BS78_02G086500 [Paspalum vaginatum]|nr:hypothetical protein BS78_02G086500 [Paspalum vaginatum]